MEESIRSGTLREGVSMRYALDRLLFQGVGAGLVMHLQPVQRRIEAVGHGRVRPAAQYVFIVLVQRIEHARADLMDLAGCQVLDLAFALDAIDGLEMVLVMHRQVAAGVDGGDMKGEAHVVGLQEQSGAVPTFRLDMAAAGARFSEVANYHDVYLRLVFRFTRRP